MTTKKALLTAFVTLLFSLFLAGVVTAQQPTPSDNDVNAIARQLYCPVCENIPLDVCPTTPCAQWRELIRQKLSEGWTERQIKDYFVQQYGARVLGTPPARGISLLVYLVPPIAVVVGIYIIFRAYKSWKRPNQQAGTSRAGESDSGQKDSTQDEYIKRMEEELRKR